MNPLDNINLSLQQQAARQVVDQLRLRYYLRVGRWRLINLSASVWNRISILQTASTSGRVWTQECQE